MPPLRALVRPPGKTYYDALTRLSPRPIVNLELARRQHAGYVAALRELGIDVAELPPDDEHPDAVFVQDRVSVLDGRAIVGPSAVAARRGETEPLIEILGRSYPIAGLSPPACLDWGDVLVNGSSLFVGLSERSNTAAVVQLREMLASSWTVEGVPLPSGLLHLLSGCSTLGEGLLLAIESLEGFAKTHGLRTVPVPAAEFAAANVLAIGGDVIMPAGYPKTAGCLERAGLRVHPVPVTEFEKRDGGVTCLCVLY